jgi:hypothetical protein
MDYLLNKIDETLPALKRLALLNYKVQNPLITSFNNLRIILSYLLERCETKLYYKLSTIAEVVFCDIKSRKIELASNSNLILEVKTELERITEVPWSISLTKLQLGETYSNFLSFLDREEEAAIKATPVVNYLLENFKNLYLDRVELEKSFH